MPVRDDEAPIVPRVEDRVVAVLRERPGRLAFGGLRRTLGVHPESLTRALRRLLRDGTIRKTEGGYELEVFPKGGSGSPSPPEVRVLASVELPLGWTREALFGELAGRWFGSVRWVGVFDHPGDPWLVWNVERTPAHVLLSVRGRELRVMVESGGGEEDGRTLGAAYELLRHAVSDLRQGRGGSKGKAGVQFHASRDVPVVDN